MNREEAEKIIDAYFDLVEKAVSICSDSPWYCPASEQEMAGVRIFLDGDDCLIEWPETEYESGIVTMEQFAFPAKLLFMGDDEIASLRSQINSIQEALEERARQENAAAQQRQIENIERREFARLKAKYEGRL